MKNIVAALAALLLALNAYAHGDEDHSHDQAVAPSHSHALSDRPKMEAASESFELVAQLEEAELSILIDRYATGEPLLGAKVEVEHEGIKAPAIFHADHGDYAVTDAKLLAAIAEAGAHALVFNIQQGEEADLLTGTLNVAEEDVGAGSHGGTWWKLALALIAAVFLAWALRAFLRRKKGALL